MRNNTQKLAIYLSVGILVFCFVQFSQHARQARVCAEVKAESVKETPKVEKKISKAKLQAALNTLTKEQRPIWLELLIDAGLVIEDDEPKPVVIKYEAYQVFGPDGNRIDNPIFEGVVKDLMDGEYKAVSISKPGQPEKRRTITVVDGTGPQPPPGPGPGPEPPPSPQPVDPPSPIKEPGLRVLILQETSSALSKDQRAIFTDPSFREILKTNCVKDAAGKTPEFRFWDKDYTADQLKYETQIWCDTYAKAKADANGVYPWIFVNNGKTFGSVPLPKTVQETANLVQKYVVTK